MTLNSMKPRSSIRRVSPSTVSATDWLLGLVMIPAEDCGLSTVSAPMFSGPLFERNTRSESRHPCDPATLPTRALFLEAVSAASRRAVIGAWSCALSGQLAQLPAQNTLDEDGYEVVHRYRGSANELFAHAVLDHLG